MARYYFDTQDNGDFFTDNDGLEFPDLEAVKVEAARGLADWAKDVLPGSIRRELTIFVRDELSRRVLTTIMIFEVQILISNA